MHHVVLNGNHIRRPDGKELSGTVPYGIACYFYPVESGQRHGIFLHRCAVKVIVGQSDDAVVTGCGDYYRMGDE